MFGIVFDVMLYIKLAIIAAALAIAGYIGYELGHSPYVELKAEIATAAAKRSAENTARAREDELKVKGLKNELEAKTLLLKRYYANGLYLKPSGSTMLSGQGTPSGTNATPSYDVLIGQCAETTLKYTLLQQYERERLQSFTKEN